MHTFTLPNNVPMARRGSSQGQLSPRESFGALHGRSGHLLSGEQSTFSILNRSTSLSIGGPEENFLGCEIEAYDPTTGEFLGLAVPLEQLSIQTFSHVYKGYFAEGPLQGQLTAIKILTTGFMSTSVKAAEVLDRLYKREVFSLSHLSHPNIVQLLAVGRVAPRHMAGGMMHVGSFAGDASVPGSPAAAAVPAEGSHHVLLLQWMPGGDARSLIDQAMRPMDEAAAGSIILPVARALQACHSVGIVHRDLKAGNVLLAPGVGKVCLADWGISVHVSESSRSMHPTGSQVRAPAAVGTEFWCAPEIERGLPHDQASDIFSLAMTFVELITGQDPKYDNSAAGIRSLNLPESGFLPENMSSEARSWVVPCLSLDPEDRPKINELLENEFFTEVAKQVEDASREMERSSHASSHLPLVPLEQEVLPEEATERGSPRDEAAAQHEHSSRGVGTQQGPKRTKKKRRGLFCGCFCPRSISPPGSDAEDNGGMQQGTFQGQQQQEQQQRQRGRDHGIAWMPGGEQTSAHGSNHGALQADPHQQPFHDTSEHGGPHFTAHPLHGGTPQHYAHSTSQHLLQYDLLEEGVPPPPARQPSRSAGGQPKADSNPLEVTRGASEHSMRRGSTGSSLVESASMSRKSLARRTAKRQGTQNPYHPPPFMFMEAMAGGFEGVMVDSQDGTRGRARSGEGMGGGGRQRAEVGGFRSSPGDVVGPSALCPDAGCSVQLEGDVQQQQRQQQQQQQEQQESHQQEHGKEAKSGSRALLPFVSFPEQHPSTRPPMIPVTMSISDQGQYPVTTAGPSSMQGGTLGSNNSMPAASAPHARTGASQSAPGDGPAAAAAAAASFPDTQVAEEPAIAALTTHDGPTPGPTARPETRPPPEEHSARIAQQSTAGPETTPANAAGAVAGEQGEHTRPGTPLSRSPPSPPLTPAPIKGSSKAAADPSTSSSSTTGGNGNSGAEHAQGMHVTAESAAAGQSAREGEMRQQQQQQQQQTQGRQGHQQHQQQLHQLQLQQQRAAAAGVRGPLLILGPRSGAWHGQQQQQQQQQQHGPASQNAPHNTSLQGSARGASSNSSTGSHPAYHYLGEGFPFQRSTGSASSKRASLSLHAPPAPASPRLATPVATPPLHAVSSPPQQPSFHPSSFPPPTWTDASHSSGSSGGSGRGSLRGLLGLLGGQHHNTIGGHRKGGRPRRLSGSLGSTQSPSGTSLREELKMHIQDSGSGGGRLLMGPHRRSDPRFVRLGSSSNSRSYDPRSLDPHATTTTTSSSSSSSTSNSVSQLVGLPIEPPSAPSSTFPTAHPSVIISSGVPVRMRSNRGTYRGGLSGEHAVVPNAPPSYLSTHYTQQRGGHHLYPSSGSTSRSSSMLGLGGFGRSSWGRSTNLRLTDLDSGSALSPRASLLSGPQLSNSSRSSRGGVSGHLTYSPHAWERLSAGPFSGSSSSGSAGGMRSMLPMMGVVMEEGGVTPGKPLLEPVQPHNSSGSISSGSNLRSTPSFQRHSSRLGRISSSGSNAAQRATMQPSLSATGGGVGVGGFDEGMQVVEENGEEKEGEEGEAVAEGSLGLMGACQLWDALAMQELVGPGLHMLLRSDTNDFHPAVGTAANQSVAPSATPKSAPQHGLFDTMLKRTSSSQVAMHNVAHSAASATACAAEAAAAAAAAVKAGAASKAADEAGDVLAGEQQQQQQARLKHTWQFWHNQAQLYFNQLRQLQEVSGNRAATKECLRATRPMHDITDTRAHGTAPAPSTNIALDAHPSHGIPEDAGHILARAAQARATSSEPLHFLGQPEHKDALALCGCAPLSDLEPPRGRHGDVGKPAVQQQQHVRRSGGDSCVVC